MAPVRVTEVLGHFHEPWYVKWVQRVGLTVANRKSKEGLKFGTILDEIVKSGGELPKKAKPDTIFAHEAFVKWRNIYQPPYIRKIDRLYAKIDGVEVTGEPDCEIPDTTIDLKGAARISLSYKIQVNVYEHIRRLNDLPPNKNVGILRCDRALGGYEYWQAPFNMRFVDAWRGLLLNYLLAKEESGDDGTEL